MILLRYAPNGLKQTVDLRNVFWGQTAFLLGGAPSLLEQPYKLLESRGVLVMAMNNAARLVRPTLFSCSDNPNCFDPQILADPGIMKFGNDSWSAVSCSRNGDGRRFRDYPNMHFWMPLRNPPWDEFFGDRAEVPWYQNTMLVSIHLLYQLGVRRIILAGSDLRVGGTDYATGQRLKQAEREWNTQLYDHLVRELRTMRPLFEQGGLELLDSSKNSRLTPVYRAISLEDGVRLCLTGFPAKPTPAEKLPHCSEFMPGGRKIKDIIADWPGDPGASATCVSTAGSPPADLQTVI